MRRNTRPNVSLHCIFFFCWRFAHNYNSKIFFIVWPSLILNLLQVCRRRRTEELSCINTSWSAERCCWLCWWDCSSQISETLVRWICGSVWVCVVRPVRWSVWPSGTILWAARSCRSLRSSLWRPASPTGGQSTSAWPRNSGRITSI